MALPKNCARRTQKRCIQADVSLESHCADGLERGVGTRRRYGQQYGSGHALWGGWGEVRVHGKCAEGEGGTGTTPQGGEGCRIKHCHCTLKAGPLAGTDQTKIKKTFEAPHNTGAASICHLLLTLALCRTFVLRCVSIGLKLLPLCPKKRGALAVLHSTLGAGGPTPEGALRATLGAIRGTRRHRSGGGRSSRGLTASNSCGTPGCRGTPDAVPNDPVWDDCHARHQIWITREQICSIFFRCFFLKTIRLRK